MSIYEQLWGTKNAISSALTFNTTKFRLKIIPIIMYYPKRHFDVLSQAPCIALTAFVCTRIAPALIHCGLCVHPHCTRIDSLWPLCALAFDSPWQRL